MAEALRRKGGKVFTNCAVRGLETKGGRISAVVTEKGAIACDTVVLAGGAWSRRFCHNLGIEFPQLTVVNSVMRTEPLDTGLTRTCSGGKFTFRKRLDGGYTVTAQSFLGGRHRAGHFPAVPRIPARPEARLEGTATAGSASASSMRRGSSGAGSWTRSRPSNRSASSIPSPCTTFSTRRRSSLKDYYPAFKPMKIAERWAGSIDATPDAVPVISKVEKLQGFHLCTGFSGHGFGLGPGAGKLMAEIVTGETPCVDPSPFRYSRFFDGTQSAADNGAVTSSASTRFPPSSPRWT